MKYRYEELSELQFEVLATLICQKLLGLGVQSFATGPDGGRDAKFVGTAERHPSTAAPWQGTVIVQAKHTQAYNASFSDTDFYSHKSKTNTIALEIPRIKRLRNAGSLDHYMLFSNRRLTAGAEEALTSLISKECGVPVGSIALCGLERMEMLLKAFPDIPALADLDPIDSPLSIGPDELSEIVEALARAKEQAIQLIDNPPTSRITLEEKNKLNGMTPAYAAAQRRRFLAETQEVQSFLSHPENDHLQKLYESVSTELALKITAKRKDHQSFDDVMNYVADHLIQRDSVLARNKRLTRLMIFYMYWNCDIGLDDNAASV